MPSATLVAHAGSSLGWPSTDTRQMRQLPTIGRVGYQQSVGISMPAARAASRIVLPSSALSLRPSIVSVAMPEIDRLAGKGGKAKLDFQTLGSIGRCRWVWSPSLPSSRNQQYAQIL